MTALVDAPIRVDVPARVDGVRLIGEAAGFGYRRPPALVRRRDGQVLQLTPLLYQVLGAIDSVRTYDEIADLVGDRLDRHVEPDDIRTLVDRHLRPLGLVRGADGSVRDLRRSSPLLGLKPRFAVTSPRATRWLTNPFRVLFLPVIATSVVVGFVAIVAWVFFERGLGASAYDAFERPHLLLLVFVASVLSAGFHEFGHAAAARYGGAQPGVIGTGLYLVWPAFYTDVTDSYRLGRAGRIRTDLGGLYFNAVVVVGTFAWWWWTGWEALLLLVATQVLQMAQQLLPLLRFDGYHLLADLAGVPDLYHRIRPTLLGLLPHRWRSPENSELKPSARAVITVWVLVTVPMLGLMLLGIIGTVPRLLATADHVIRTDAELVSAAWGRSDALDVAGHSLEILSVVVPTLGCVLILSRVGARFFTGLARWSRGSALKRVVATLLGTTLITGLAWAWWPHPGSYVPIQPGEKAPLSAVLHEPPFTVIDGLARTGIPRGSTPATEPTPTPEQPAVAAFPEGQELPTKADPVLAMVLVPSADQGSGNPIEPHEGGGTGTTPPQPDTPPTWVFPFDQPLRPGEGDNQALAVNTTDDSVVYDIAFALVWADGRQVLNVNEAHAYASCSDCAAVAVAFQVVLVLDGAQVIVPQNLAVAANYECLRCITAAIASQLVLSVDGAPSEEQMQSLAAVWNDLLAFAQSLSSYSLAEIRNRLDEAKGEIAAILGTPATLATEPTSPSTSPTSTPPETTSPAEPTATPTTFPTPTDTASPTAPAPTEQTASPNPTPTPTPTPSPTPSPTPTPTPTPTASPSLAESATP